MAGNGVLGLLAFAEEAFTEAGVPAERAREALVGLAEGALANARRTGDVVGALTGPVVRGDTGTLDRHLECLEAALPGRRALYLELVRVLLDVARRRADQERSAPVEGWLRRQT